jgi:fatty-acyl-CoA synthase
VSTVASLLAARADDEHPAILDPTGTWTWRQAVAAGATRGALAVSLRRPGPFHIGVLLPNVPEYLFWLEGAALTGATVVGINPTRRGEALAADVRATDCQLVVTDATGAALLDGLDLGPAQVLVTGTPRYEEMVAAVPDAVRVAVHEQAGSLGPNEL